MAKNNSLFFDLDGTLLGENKQLSNKTIAYVKKLKSKYNIGIATGRPVYMIKKQISELKPDLPIISINGGLVSDKNGNDSKPLFEKELDKADSLVIFEICKKYKLNFLAYTNNTMYYYEGVTSKRIKWTHDLLSSYKEKHRWPFKNILNMDFKKLDLIKFLVLTSEAQEKDVNELKKVVGKLNSSYWVASQKKVIDIMHKDVSKGNALKFIAKNFGMNLKNTIVFGDAHNDISMFEVAGKSVALQNATPETKAAATHTSKLTNIDNGVIHWLKENL